jgi:hypothetical protein
MKSVPSYWIPHLEEKLKKIRKNAEDGVTDSFIFISDIHSENNTLLSPALAQYIKENTGIDRVIIGGDLINGNKEKEKALAAMEAALQELAPLRPYFVRGNHDQNTDWGPITPENFFYDALYRERVMGIAANECVPGKFYGHLDVPAAKLRYFFLDTGTCYSEVFGSMDGNYDWVGGRTAPYQEQLIYLKEKASELPADWGIIAVQHILIGGGPADKSQIQNIINQPLLDCLDELATKENSPAVIAAFCGHNHRDRMIVSPAGYPVISLTCDGGGSSSWDWDADNRTRTPGTTEEQAFDVVQIDRASRTIYMTRIGVGRDRACRF